MLTMNDILRMRAHIEAMSTSIINDDEALEKQWMFPKYEIGKQYAVNDRFTCGGKLYKVRLAHTSQEEWTPDSAASLYECIALPSESGTADNPIEYGGNMELIEGLYYVQDGILYHCTRDSGAPLYHALSALVGLYVEVAE